MPPSTLPMHAKRAPARACFFLLTLMVLAVGAAISSQAAQGQPILALEPGQDSFRLGLYMEIMEDPGAKLDLGQVASPAMTSRFRPVKSDTINLGVSSSAFWLRFKLRQPAEQKGLDQAGWILDVSQPALTYVALYFGEPSQTNPGWRKLQTLSRDLKPFPQPSRYAVFRLPDAPGQELVFYMRVLGTSLNSMDPRIYSQVGFLDYNRGQLWLLGAYCGAILALAIYYLVVFFSLRDRSYLWYVLTIVSMALYYLGWNGLVQDYMRFLPVELNRHLPIAFLSVLFLCRGQFARYFLLTNEEAPILDRVIIVASLAMAIIAIMVPVSAGGGFRLFAIKLSALGAIAWPWLLIFIVWRRWRQGFRPALYFLVFYLPTAIGQLTSMLTILKVLPFYELGFFSHQIASYFEPILMALALGYRIRSMRQEKQGAEQAARESELRHRLVMEAAPDPIAVCDAAGRLTYANPAFERVFGWSGGEALGRDMSKVLLSGGLSHDLTEGGQVKNWETRFGTKQAGEIDISVSAATLMDSGGQVNGLVLIMQDISQRKQSEAEKARYQSSLRKLALELTKAEERERHRIADDLHDSVSQSLAFSAFSLKRLRSQLSGPPQEELNNICSVLDQSIKDIRSLTFEISPPVLYDYGLAAALDWLASHTAERHSLEVEVSEKGESVELDQDRQVDLYRAGRELLVNAVKHSMAKKVRIDVVYGNGQVTLSVTDDGRGFDAAGVEKGASGGFGLFSLRERLTPLGGELVVESQPGQGSRISLSLPLAST